MRTERTPRVGEFIRCDDGRAGVVTRFTGSMMFFGAGDDFIVVQGPSLLSRMRALAQAGFVIVACEACGRSHRPLERGWGEWNCHLARES